MKYFCIALFSLLISSAAIAEGESTLSGLSQVEPVALHMSAEPIMVSASEMELQYIDSALPALILANSQPLGSCKNKAWCSDDFDCDGGSCLGGRCICPAQ